MVITFQRKTMISGKASWSDAFSVDAEIREGEKSVAFKVKRNDVNEDMRIKAQGDYYKINSVKSGVVNAIKEKE